MTPDELLKRNDKNLFLTGSAGSGKTHLVRSVIELQPNWGLLTASTGTAARVLGDGVPTTHDALGLHGSTIVASALTHNLNNLRWKFNRIIVDEVSMLTLPMFESLVKAAKAAKIGLVMVGDWAQLPPIQEHENNPKFAFESHLWKETFEDHTIVLDTQWRHEGPFLTACNLLRAGKGLEAIPYL